MKHNENYEKLLTDIGLYYRALRGNQKLENIQDIIGIHHSIISRIENGRYPCLNLQTLQKLSDYYGVALTDIINL